jgi:hypothetical protein
MAVEAQSGRRTWRVVVGWSAVALNLLVSCLWAFWGAIENFHEGWHHGHLGLNLLWTLAYLGPMLAAILFGLLGLRWPRLGGLAYLIAGGYFARRYLFGRIGSISGAGVLLALLMAGGCGLIGLLFWLGQPRPRRLAYHLSWGLPLAVALVSGAEGAWRVSTRHDDGDRGMRTVEGNGVRLTWAPAGPGWPTVGVSLDEAKRICRYLSEDGLRLADKPQDVWRLPTVQEVVRSLTRHGRNAGGEWDEQAHQATFHTRPDKESPLWNPDSQIIYWWTASDADSDHVYRVVYSGYVLVVPKKMSMGSCAFRAVRRVPPNRGEKGQ